jgi:hypothetical protein
VDFVAARELAAGFARNALLTLFGPLVLKTDRVANSAPTARRYAKRCLAGQGDFTFGAHETGRISPQARYALFGQRTRRSLYLIPLLCHAVAANTFYRETADFRVGTPRFPGTFTDNLSAARKQAGSLQRNRRDPMLFPLKKRHGMNGLKGFRAFENLVRRTGTSPLFCCSNCKKPAQ